MRFPPVFSFPAIAFIATVSFLPWARGAEGAEFSFVDKPGEYLDVLHGGKVIARYMNGHDVSTPARRLETYKPYLHVFDAAGSGPITKGAGGSFTHHRGIYLGWNKIGIGDKTFDRWHMSGGDQVHEKFLHQEAGKDRAVFTSLIRWQGATPDTTILEEERTFTFLPPPAPGYVLIDVASKLKAVAGETTLGGDPEHAGLHFRPAEELDRTKTTYVYPREKANAHQDLDYPWFGESYTLGEKRYSVVYLNHPGNPTGGRISAYRNYGRFGAFWTVSLPANGTLEIRARFIVCEGEIPSPEIIQKAWNDYTGKNEPVPAVTEKPAEGSGKPAAPKKPDAAATPAAKPTGANGPKGAAGVEAKPVAIEPNTVIAKSEEVPTGPKRAGGGPVNPVIKFKLPPPPVLTPEETIKTFKLPPGFKAEVVASEPMIEAPVAISWDDQGRLYVCEMRGYMHDVDGTGEDQPIGRVSRLEDIDGDGKMDKATVFADNLVMPRAVMALGDGAIINEPPNLVWYRDTDGDGVADKKEIVSDRYATKGGQPEHMANSPTWLMDNWITSAGYGYRFRFKDGQFQRDDSAAAGQWGLTQDDWGRRYTNSNSDLLRADLVPPGYYLRNPRLMSRTGLLFQVMKTQTVWPARPNPGVNRGYIEDAKKPDGTMGKGTLRADGRLQSVTGTCGPAIYRGDLFPKEFRGNAFIPEPCGNLVKRLILSETNGEVIGKNAYEGSEFLTSTDERFRPVNAYTGPDGALYIVDMARGIIQHKGFLTYYLVANIQERKLETPFNLGRIYRIVPDNAQPKAVKLPKEPVQIASMLTHANGWVRDTAQRVLVERGDTSVVPVVEKLAATHASPETRVQSLWTLEGLGALTPEVIAAGLSDKHEKVRSAAVRLADPTMGGLLKLAQDPSTEVRLHLAFKLSGQPAAEAALVELLASGGPMFGEAVASGLNGTELEYIETLLKLPATEDAKFAKSNILATLAGCVMKERKAPRVARLLELTAAQPPAGIRQIALLNGLAGKPPSKGSKAGTIPNPLKFPTGPPALMTLLASGDARVKPLVVRVDQQLAWAGKPGWVESKLAPLTAAEQALFDKGKAIYSTICTACHQPNGQGMAGLAPTLVNSEWTLGPTDRLIRIVTQGMTGPIEVAGVKWQLEMPGLPIFSDEEVAGILTYIRREWEHTASPVSPSFVTSVRAAIKERTKPWTAEELREPVRVKTASAK
jgi:mono/diheme cytochrome c family protein/glucose/arabinose dehydrogenase